jgi:hypothetical protein
MGSACLTLPLLTERKRKAQVPKAQFRTAAEASTKCAQRSMQLSRFERFFVTRIGPAKEKGAAETAP